MSVSLTRFQFVSPLREHRHEWRSCQSVSVPRETVKAQVRGLKPDTKSKTCQGVSAPETTDTNDTRSIERVSGRAGVSAPPGDPQKIREMGRSCLSKAGA
jgi:hypothetical protein